MRIYLKYPIKVGKKHWPKGTEVKCAQREEVLAVWPGMKDGNDGRTAITQVAVTFPEMDHCTIVDESQLNFI